MEIQQVTLENCEEVAGDLQFKLIGYRLTIISFYSNASYIERPTVVKNVRVTGHLSYKSGLLKIELKPRRSITWDVSKEKVTVEYLDDGVIIIQRMMTDTKAIQRVIILEEQ